ncbi:MAG: class I SAM-dependent methyltransferase [Candidatus Omnitrophota bacterium]
MNIIKQRYMYERSDFSGKKILDLGCGNRKFEKATGVDRSPNTAADIIHDLDIFPYPIEDDTFDIVICRHSIEHILYICKAMEEIYRITRPNGSVIIVYPHFSAIGCYSEPEHFHALSYSAFEFFCNTNRYKTRFEISKRRIYFGGGFKTISGVEWLVNRFPRLYDAHLSHTLPASSVEVWLKAVK